MTLEDYGDTKTEHGNGSGGGVGDSFYGALNSDEVARLMLEGVGEDPNYPETDKQTADKKGKNIEAGRRHF